MARTQWSPKSLAPLKTLKEDSLNEAIHFSGSGFMLPFQFGVVAALRAHNVRFVSATASSGGVMAALAVLNAADLDLGVRQCFDLRAESATIPSSVKAFFAVYRQYFRCFRAATEKARAPIASLKGKLWVRLGRLTWSGFVVDAIGDFETEQELEDAFMSAAYIPCGTSVLPPMFRGRLAIDAVLVELLRFTPLIYGKNEASLWPPVKTSDDGNVGEENTNGETDGETGNGVRCIVVTFGPIRGPWLQTINNVDETGVVCVQGSASGVFDFWASPLRMREGFIEGYCLMADKIEAADCRAKGLSPTKPQPREAAEKLLNALLTDHEDWKAKRGFAKPSLWMEHDALLPIVALLLGLAAMVIWPLGLA